MDILHSMLIILWIIVFKSQETEDRKVDVCLKFGLMASNFSCSFPPFPLKSAYSYLKTSKEIFLSDEASLKFIKQYINTKKLVFYNKAVFL